MKRLILLIPIILIFSCNPPVKLERDFKPMRQYSEFKGEILWDMKLKGDQIGTGAAFANGNIFIGTTQKWIYVFDAASGKKIDRMWTDIPIEIPPTIDDSLLFYSGAGQWNQMVATNIYTGEELWEKSARTSGSRIISHDSTAFFATSAGGIYKISRRDGKILKDRKLDAGLSSEMLLAGNSLFIGLRNGSIIILDRHSLEKNKEIKLDSPVAEKFTYIGTDIYAILENGKLLIIDHKSLNIKDSLDLEGHFDSAPLLVKDLIFTANNAANLSCISIDGLKLIWEKKLDEMPPLDHPKDAKYDLSGEASVFASPIQINGKIIIITYRGSLYLIEPQTSRIELQKKMKGRFIKTPQLYNSIVFLFSENSEIIAIR